MKINVNNLENMNSNLDVIEGLLGALNDELDAVFERTPKAKENLLQVNDALYTFHELIRDENIIKSLMVSITDILKETNQTLSKEIDNSYGQQKKGEFLKDMAKNNFNNNETATDERYFITAHDHIGNRLFVMVEGQITDEMINQMQISDDEALLKAVRRLLNTLDER